MKLLVLMNNEINRKRRIFSTIRYKGPRYLVQEGHRDFYVFY